MVPGLAYANIIGTKWIFKNKTNENGDVTRNKAQMVAQGYAQIEGINFGETFVPVTCLEVIRLLLSFTCIQRIKLFQMDFKSAFLNGFLSEEVYVSKPKGFIVPFHSKYVYKLCKVQYGLKQAPRAWYERISEYLSQQGYDRGATNKTMFIKRTDSNFLIA